MKVFFFLSKIEKLLAASMKNEMIHINKLIGERANVIADSMEIQRILRELHEQHTELDNRKK